MDDFDGSVLDWLREPSLDRGVNFATTNDGWDRWDYRDLARLVEYAALELGQLGVGANGSVVIASRTRPHFLGALYATTALGAAASRIPPPAHLANLDGFRHHVAAVVGALEPTVVVTDVATNAAIATVCSDLDLAPPVVVSVPPSLPGQVSAPPEVDRGRPALVQFTSGSSGPARGVTITHGGLASNVSALRRWLGMGPSDATATWLPAHHDMGLV